MDLLDRLLGHDTWTTRQLLLRCRELSDVQLDREFDIAHRTVRATLAHIVRNVEAWTDLMHSPTTPTDARPQGRSVAELLERQERAAADLARVARGVARRGAWDTTWIDRLDDPPTTKTYGGAIAHILTHSMHHRAQLLYMMKKLGVEGLPEGDVLSWEQQAQGPK